MGSQKKGGAKSFAKSGAKAAGGKSPAIKTIEHPAIPVGAQLFDKENPQGMGLFRLSTTVITLIVGAGVFTMSGDQAAGGASGAAIATAWGISGVGVLCLVLTFFALSRLKPGVTGGIFTYAHKGFGEFIGFASAWGYWWSALLTTVTFCALLFESLAYFFPFFGAGDNIWCLVAASVLVWGYAALAARGIGEISLVNAVITVSKIVPILLSIILIIFLGKFDPQLFWQNMHSGSNPDLAFLDQVKSALMLTMWVFVGIEGAVAVSGRAKRQSDVGKATIIAFCCVMAIYLSVSMLSMGIMPLSDLAGLQNPSLAYVMEAVVGPWGAGFISFAVSLSLVGAMLGYTILATEAPYFAAEQGIFPKAFTRTNKRGAPVVTILATTIIVEVCLCFWVFTGEAYQFFYVICAAMILIPYLLSAAYFARVTIEDKGLFKGRLGAPLGLWRAVAVIGVVYSFFLAFAAGDNGCSLMFVLYLVGLPLYFWQRKQMHPGEPLLPTWLDKTGFAFFLAAGIISALLLATGMVTI
ncbi:MAG: amino acid permease [Eggerthellaceae bacterium]|nr:amino acid permease [Eggerthellaceae bacterium]